MASIYQLKSRFQDILRPLCRFLAKIGVTANQVTVLALLLSLAFGSYMAFRFLYFPERKLFLLGLPVLLLLRMALNAIDGMLAREHNMKSHAGAFLNELGDVLSDAFLYLPFALYGIQHGNVEPWIALSVVIFVKFAIITEFMGVLSQATGSSRRYDGPMGKSDRAFWCSVLAIYLALGGPDRPYTEIFFALLAALSLLTVIVRARKALQE
ncbi:MAG TPA: CDP-alcohol phosphatidyltransferase [Leptospiraceae bacterium]|nr:CDP-alcohol phosphatidyltransferase [Spirochaetaceae bacterium]HBS06884.1 CDP-alcohol phosphatidyltransferase [Leptospiraceae bacterium]